MVIKPDALQHSDASTGPGKRRLTNTGKDVWVCAGLEGSWER